MGNLQNILDSKMEATDALIFYKSSLSNQGAYVEYRPIKKGKMQAGCPLSVDAMSKLIKSVEKFANNTTSMVTLHGIIPENLLYASSSIDSYKLVWYRKPEKRMMYFVEELGIPDGKMMVPGLVYSTDGRTMRVFAYKGSKPNGILYHAPFFNVSDIVCLGNSKLSKPKEHTYVNWMECWENVFWKSEFAHILGTNPVKGNLALITKDCIINNKPFPMKELKKTNITLQKLYEM